MAWRAPATLLLVLLLLPALSPLAAAGATQPSCTDATRASAVGIPGTTDYAWTDSGTVQVWNETNGLPGLQTVACTQTGGSTVPADTLLASVPPALPPIPDINPSGCYGHVIIFGHLITVCI